MKGYLVMLEGPSFQGMFFSDKFRVYLDREEAVSYAKINGYEDFVSISDKVGTLSVYSNGQDIIRVLPLRINADVGEDKLFIKALEVQEYKTTEGVDTFTAVNDLRREKINNFIEQLTSIEDVKVALRYILRYSNLVFNVNNKER